MATPFGLPKYGRGMSMDDMVRVTAGEFGREVGRYQDLALTQPLIITRNGRGSHGDDLS
jgi:hypothetical protein